MSDGTLKINGEVVEATEFAYNGCHKIYLITFSGDRDLMLECGYTEDDIYPVEMLPDIWATTCPLRFISSADLSVHYVEQCDETASVTWEPS
ncbi:hypothetical protein [Mycolicibacterium fortuitum]|uniref:Uncharacterized protein n=2 Tax=Mycolicibacterium fortuitum TaxID=1766 RepID=A0AAE5AH62_MYCFO|nr:hypothetical protein [Mycolicibacterium fortuitum]MCV7137569.1 hypothetical protein [Mycolicibacterium fortuitum]MDV7195657.1 hypothetical protein [Mycolicibacterium fortuitum]MDV7209332.1 hypothetical protein [Mycolicibacterium fortuitum]MDV7231170.1 hypothetical protein [Mycolicibacterium fortuitum]MDV7262745.1 hypothetical protein [Mycolicibacterium fortuitum]